MCMCDCGVSDVRGRFKVSIRALLDSSSWVPLFQASEKMELTMLWERTWQEARESESPLSDWLEWLDCDSGKLEELDPDFMLELDRDVQS